MLKKCYISEIKNTYNVIGDDIYAWNDYAKPKGNNPHSRGASVGKPAFSLKGLKITVTELIHRVEEGWVTGKKEFAAFEIVRAVVEGRPGVYYVWVVYEGVVKIDASKNDDCPQDNIKKPLDKKETKDGQYNLQAARTLILDSKKTTPKKEDKTGQSDKKLAITVVDEKGSIRKSDCHVVFINTLYEETYVEIKNGTGGTNDLPAGNYKIIVDNRKIDINVNSNNKGLSVFNPVYCRPGFVYQVTSQNNIIQNKAYETFWPKRGPTEDDFYRGVYTQTAPFNDPQTPDAGKILGSFLPGDYCVLDQVLLHGKTQSNPDRELVALKFSKPGIENKDVFTFVSNETAPELTIASADFTYDGSAALLQVETKELAFRNGAQKKPQLYTPATSAPLQETKPDITHIHWILRDQDANKKEIQLLYHRNTSYPDEPMHGVCYKKGVLPAFRVLVKNKLKSTRYKIEIMFWAVEVEKPINQMRSEFEKKYKLQQTNTDTTKKFIIVKEYEIHKEKDLGQSNASSGTYEILMGQDDFYQIATGLNINLNKSKIGMVIERKGSPVKDWTYSSYFAYPVLQHIILFLPGLFGSDMHVINDTINPPESEKIWISVNQKGHKELELAECNNDGTAIRQAINDKLKVLSTYKVEDNIDSVNNTTNDFPYIFKKVEGSEIKINHLIYAPAGYDWRLPMNKVSSNPVFNEFPFLGHIYNQIETAYNTALTNIIFHDGTVVLSGHSTGGVAMTGLLSLPNLRFFNNSSSLFNDRVRSAYYMNVPFLGAPKAEVIRLTGEADFIVNILINRDVMLQIAQNLPVGYILAPSGGYAKYMGKKWERDEQKARFIYAVKNGYFKIKPKEMNTGETYPPYSGTRDPLVYNNYLSKMAESFYLMWLKNYSTKVPSYIFHFGCMDTISEILFSPELSDYGRKNLFNKAFKTLWVIGVAYHTRALNSLQTENWADFTAMIIEFDKSFTNIEDKRFKHWEKYWNIAKFVTIHKNECWIAYVATDSLLPYYLIIKMEETGSLSISEGSRIIEKKVVEKSFGDGTVPRVSQTGLWHLLSNNSPAAHSKRHGNIHVFPETPAGYFDSHQDGANPVWVWHNVAQTLTNLYSGSAFVQPADACSADAFAPKNTGVNVANALVVPQYGSSVLYLLDNANNPFPRLTKVALARASGASLGDYYLQEKGILELNDVPPGEIRITGIVLPSDNPVV